VPTIVWFRHDLRLADNPALTAAVAAARADGDGRVVPLFVVDPARWDAASADDRAYLVASLRALDASIDDALLLQHGHPVDVLPALVRATAATSVHAAAAVDAAEAALDATVTARVAVPFVRTGSAHAVPPEPVEPAGAVLAGSVPTGAVGDDPTDFEARYRAWLRAGWPPPTPAPHGVCWWLAVECHGYPAPGPTSDPDPDLRPTAGEAAGEAAALRTWAVLRADAHVDALGLDTRTDRPDVARLARHLRHGEIHPRTLLADLGDGVADEILRRDLCRRELHT